MLNYNITADMLTENGTDTCILPIGSVEQHGPHLPIGTDVILANAFAERIGEKIGCLVLPALPFSTCYEHRGKKGSVWMKPETLYRVIEDLVICLKSQGFKKIIVLISHGGVFIAAPVIRELNACNTDITVVKLDLVEIYFSPEVKRFQECSNNLHACEIETSLMLYLNEGLVRKDKIVDFIPDIPRGYLNYASIFAFCPEGVWGKPSLATQQKGEQLFKTVVDLSVEYIVTVFRKLK
ncbi:MAG: creatininase family protein [Spirochaetota bacterium]